MQHRVRLPVVALMAVLSWAAAANRAASLRAAEPPEQKLVFSDDLRGGGHFDIRTVHESVPERTGNWAVKITDLPDGRLLMVWCSTSGTEVSPTNRLWISYSSDDGKTWNRPEVFAQSTGDESVLNPCCYTHSNGEVFVFYNVIGDAAGYNVNTASATFRVAYQTSDNLGAVWSPRRMMPVGDVNAGLMSSPIRLRDGTILLPMYIECVERERRGHWVGITMRSADGGKTWSRGEEFDVAAPQGASEPTIAELSDGQLYCLMRTKTGWQYECRSTDGGRTWTKPTQSPFPSPEAMGIVHRLASGGLIFVWDNNTLSGGNQTPRYPLFAAVSDDDAKTWPLQKMIETTVVGKQLSNHGVFQTRAGTILVAMNHFQGVRGPRGNRAEYGPIEVARFDEVWLRSLLSPSKWQAGPAETGGIRLEPSGVLLVSGAAGEEQTFLASRLKLPLRCTIQCELTDVEQRPSTCNGLFVGAPPWEPGKPWLCFARSRIDPKTPAVVLYDSARGQEQRANERIQLSPGRYYESTMVRIRLDGNRIAYEDSSGAKTAWIPLPKGLAGPLPWGFFSRNTGAQGRLRIRGVRVFADP